MRNQKFIVTIATGEKDGCGNPIPHLTEGNVRIALCEKLPVEEVSVEEVKGNRYAVATYNSDTRKLCVAVMDIGGVFELLREHRHFDYEPETVDRIKAMVDGPKGYTVDFHALRIKIKKL